MPKTLKMQERVESEIAERNRIIALRKSADAGLQVVSLIGDVALGDIVVTDIDRDPVNVAGERKARKPQNKLGRHVADAATCKLVDDTTIIRDGRAVAVKRTGRDIDYNADGTSDVQATLALQHQLRVRRVSRRTSI